MLNVARMLTCHFAVSAPGPSEIFRGMRRIGLALKALMLIMLCGPLVCCTTANMQRLFTDPVAPPPPCWLDNSNQNPPAGQPDDGVVYSVTQFNRDWSRFKCACFNLPCSDDRVCTELRNRIVLGTMFQIDMNYRQYADVLYAGRAAAQTASDMALLGLTAAGAVVDGSAVKSILSATATAVTGTRASVDSNLFKQQATEIFLNAMEDIRTQKRNIIQDKLQQSITDYSIYQAFVDLVAYYDAGTIRAAYQGLQQSSVALKSEPKPVPDAKGDLVKACKSLKQTDAQKILKALGREQPKDPTDSVPSLVQFVINTTDPVTVDRVKNAVDILARPPAAKPDVKGHLIKACRDLNEDKEEAEKEAKAEKVLNALEQQCSGNCFSLLMKTVINASDPTTLDKISDAFDMLAGPDSKANQSPDLKAELLIACKTLSENKARAILEALGIQCNHECLPLLTQTVIDTCDLTTLDKIKNAFDIQGKTE